MRRGVAGPLLVAAAAFGCAQPGTPPGGQPDNTPPRVTEVFPAAFDTLTDPRAPAVIRFDERISERLEGVRDWNDAVLVSPVTSRVRVKAGRRRLEISLADGWEPQRVYSVVVRPVFRDLFNNLRAEPVELVFSTGASISEAAIAGFVTDRITGRVVADARVVATRRIDSSAYVALSDTAGFFAMRYVPAGAYDIRAWQDQDRDREPGFFEIQDTTEVVFGSRDTAVVELALLPPDTTPARLARAEVLDSAKVQLLFDDHFAVGPVDGVASLHSLPDSARVGSGTLIHQSQLDSVLAAERGLREARQAARDTAAARADTAAIETPAVDTAGADPAAADTVAEVPLPQRRQDERVGQRAQREAAAPQEPLPSQELVLLLDQLLLPDTVYYVTVRGVTNIQGVPGGGGSVAFRTPPPPADTIPPDTIPPDTIPPDTIPPDTLPPDTLPPDTLPPDTLPPAPEGVPHPGRWLP